MRSTATGVAVLLLCSLAAAASIAAALVRNEPRESGSGLAASFWPGHPAVLRETAMGAVGQAAAKGELPGPEAMQRIRQLANRAPLQPDAFLVEAALAQKRGELGRAEQLLIEARRRDPRSLAARFLLATLYLKTGAILPGLREMNVLTRFIPGGPEQVAPGLAQYATTSTAVPMLKQLLAESPELEPRLLWELADDADNTDVILQLATRRLAADGSAPPWQARLLETLVADRQYARAHKIWAHLSGIQSPAAGLFRPDFVETAAPPPFDWDLAKQGGGIAEPVPGGGLHVLHYGRDRVVLAGQLTILPSGRYQLSMSVSGNVGAEGQLRWLVRCLPGGRPVLDLPLTRSGTRLAGVFEARAGGCGAYQIELVGNAQEAPSSSDATISALRLARVSG